MRIAVFGIFSNFVPLFAELRKTLRQRGHRIYFVNPRNYDARSWLTGKGIGYFFREKPKRPKDIFTREELDKIVHFQYRMEAFFEENSELKERLIAYAKNQAVVIDDFLCAKKIDLLVVWNGAYIDSQIGIRLAQRRGIKIVYLENGFFPRTLQIDPVGINYDNSISSLSPDFFREIKFDEERYEKFIDDYKMGNPPNLPKAPQFQLDFLGKALFKYTLLRHHDFGHPYFLPAPLRRLFGIEDPSPKYSPPKGDEPPPKIKKPYILVPLQVHDDSQIINLSPLVHNMEQFVEAVHRATKEAFGDDYALVVKEHPVDRSRGFVYPDLKERFSDIIWLGKFDIKKALEEASLVVTINSTVGLEALIYEKPVVTLGLAFYNKLGLVFHANSLDELSETMKLAISQGPDKALVKRFLYHLRFDYVVEGNYNYFDRKTVDDMADRIIALSRGAK